MKYSCWVPDDNFRKIKPDPLGHLTTDSQFSGFLYAGEDVSPDWSGALPRSEVSGLGWRGYLRLPRSEVSGLGWRGYLRLPRSEVPSLGWPGLIAAFEIWSSWFGVTVPVAGGGPRDVNPNMTNRWPHRSWVAGVEEFPEKWKGAKDQIKSANTSKRSPKSHRGIARSFFLEKVPKQNLNFEF
jgi:hypothetical protein